MAGLIKEAYKTGGGRAWNKIAKIIGSADEQGLVQDIGQKAMEGDGLPIHVHEFVANGTVYSIVALEDLEELQKAYITLRDEADYPLWR